MGTIQKSPAGYRDLLGLVGAGQAPNNVETELTPTLDTTPFYLSRGLEVRATSVAAFNLATAGTMVTLSVPATESWLVYSFGGILSNISVAASEVYANLSIQVGNVATPIFQDKWRANLNVADVMRFGGTVPPIVLNAGSSMIVQNMKSQTRTIDVDLSALVSVLNTG